MTMTDIPIVSENGNSGGLTHCPQCNEPVRPGELVCSNCNFILASASASSATKALKRAEEFFEKGRPKIGSALRRLQKVTLLIDGKQAPLPSGQKVIIGRADPHSNSPRPDLDLTPFGALEMGVSRQHVEISWKNDLVFIADVGSTNGTLLNGQELLKGIERILRDNDKLVIGHMPVIVHFVDG